MLTALVLAAMASLPQAERDAYFDKPPQNTLRDCGAEPESYGECRLPPALTAAQIETRLAGKKTAWWREGDQFVVVARRDTDQAYLCCAARGRMDRVAGDLWALRLRIVDLDRATIDISVRPEPDGPADVYRGPLAPAPLAQAKELKGRLHAEVLKSEYLDDPRAVLIYTPPGAGAGKTYPAVYMADGNMRLDTPGFIEPLILAGRLPPMILVEIWPGNSRKRGEDRRSQEYLPGWPGGTPWFLKHESFVLKELIPFVEAKYGALPDPKRRVVTGFSSGAAWAIAMGLRHPDVFPNVIAQSLVWSDTGSGSSWQLGMALQRPGAMAGIAQPTPSAEFLKGLDESTTARFYLSAGTLEPAFYEGTRRFADRARAAGHAVKLDTTVSGHTFVAWSPLLVQGLRWMLD